MLYHLAQYKDLFSALNLFQYITFRAGGAFVTAFLIFLFAGKPFIRFLLRVKMQMTIREYGPQSHLKKAGTPTMGGVLMWIAITAATLLWARPENRFIILMIVSSIYLGIMGYLDDHQKWVRRHPGDGMSRTAKLLAQAVLAAGVAAYLHYFPPNPETATRLFIPYLKDVFIPLGIFYVVLVAVVLVGTTNAVNLTDGLDGLAAGTLLTNVLTFAVFAYLAGNVKFSHYLRIVHVPGAGEIAVYMAAMAGGCLGFLWFNAHPAEIFMGDTGSLFLGGGLALAALCLQQELILVVAGGIFVAEAVSVQLQIGSVRFRKGKRVFRMAPLHHHFEELGWPETKVTIRFWILSVMLALLALASLKVR